MKKYLVIIVLTFLCFRADGVTVPSGVISSSSLTVSVDPLTYFSTLSLKEVQKLAGRKLSLKEKVAVKVFQWKIKKGLVPLKKADEKKDKGKTAMIFGIIGLAALLLPIPYIGGIAALVFTILALTMGYKARKENPENTRAKTAIILGWITVGLFILAFVIALAVISTWAWGWG